ncbi:MAG: putative LPS assembly protein LptD [Chitinophagales bacterium]
MRALYTLVVQIAFFVPIFAQETVDDTLVYENQSSFDTVDIKSSDDELTSPITYAAQDSIVYDIKNQMLYLYGNADMDYDKIELESEFVQFDWNTMTLSANGNRDSTGAEYGTPIFKEGDGEYVSKKMEYNFKTGKGRTYDVITQQDEAYIHSEVVKKNKDNEWYGLHTKFTTCEHHDHPHFYIEAKKSKVVPDKVMVTGPANLVIEGINTPLVLPFAIFPLKKGQRSGLIFPQYEVIPVTGEFAFRGGGYYWAVNERLGLQFTTDISTRARFRIGVAADYKKIYKFSGNFSFNYNYTPPTDKLISKAGKTHDYNINWTHRLDNKASKKHGFSANVTILSSSYITNSRQTEHDVVLNPEFQSNINYTRKFSGKPYTLTASASHNQNLNTHVFNVTLPNVAFNVTRFNPIQRKVKTQKKTFYENIGFRYRIEGKTQVNTIDSLLFKKETKDKIEYGIKQTATIDAPFDLFKYFKVTPSFTYNEKWYFKKEDRISQIDTSFVMQADGSIDTIINTYATDTLKGFFPVRDFTFRTSVSTAVTGIYNFKGKKLKAIRHVVKPSISYTYKPDFSEDKWNYYDSYYDEIEDENIEYNSFQNIGAIYGSTSKGKQNALTFDVTSNLEMKLFDRKDTSKVFKYVPIIENIRVSGGYNFGAEEKKINDLRVNLTSSLYKNILTWGYNVNLSAYTRDSINNRTNTTVWQSDKRLMEWSTMNFNLGLRLKGKKKENNNSSHGTINEREYVLNNPNHFYDFNIPWDFRIGYNFNFSNGHRNNTDSLNVTANSLSFNGNVNITPNWKFNVRTGYDIRDKDFTRTTFAVVRNLHCWVLSFNWTAYPVQSQIFTIDLRVLSPLLQELKLSRKNPPNNGLTTF